MDQQSRTLRFGAAVIAWAVLARLGLGGAFRPLVEKFRQPETQSFLIYLETGRYVRFSPSSEEISNPVGESPAPAVPAETQALPVFSRDAVGEMSYACSYRPDLESLIEQPLAWNLTGPDPRVLILHTHTTESYTPTGAGYAETSAFRTLDENHNMLAVGARVAQLLEEAGIGVIHDRELHDYPSYNGSYNHARKAIQAILAEHPEICLVLDLHRDASGDLNNQFRPAALVEGVSAARMMLVMGTGAGGLEHPHWQENLALGLKLQAQLELLAPGITRPINLRAQRFNQDLTTGSLLVEMGAAGNTLQEALEAADLLAQAIIALARGANGE